MAILSLSQELGNWLTELVWRFNTNLEAKMSISVGLGSIVIHPIAVKVETSDMTIDYCFSYIQRRRPSNRDNSAVTG